MKKIFWQSEWQNIKFKNINIPKSVFHLPSSDFYSAFYSELFKKYGGFNDLPTKWKNDKEGIAKEIIKLLRPYKNALSVGCGLGFIEKEIVKNLQELNIDAFFTPDELLNLHSGMFNVSKVFRKTKKLLELINRVESILFSISFNFFTKK